MKDDKLNLEHAIRVFQMEMGYKPDPSNEKDSATVGILEVGIRYALSGNLLSTVGLDSFHEALYQATDKEFDDDTLYDLWLRLPMNMKKDAQRWGVNDSVVQDRIYTWATQNPEVFYDIGNKEE